MVTIVMHRLVDIRPDLVLRKRRHQLMDRRLPSWDVPTRHQTYQFPLENTTLKYSKTGGYVDAEVVQLTRWRAYWNVDGRWRKFRGPFARPFVSPDDAQWRWGTFVRRRRKNIWARCAALRTQDGGYQGALIYRRDGRSLLEANAPAVCVEYAAAAPWNRRDLAESPLYLGVGEALMFLSILHSHEWGLGGRVVLFSLPRALGFYKKLKFVETGRHEDRMIHCELTPEAAIDLLESRGLI